MLMLRYWSEKVNRKCKRLGIGDTPVLDTYACSFDAKSTIPPIRDVSVLEKQFPMTLRPFKRSFGT